MKQRKTNTTTLDDLADMVASGFESVDKRFEEVEQKMATKEDLKELRVELRGDVNALSKKVDKLDYQVDEVYDILKRFEENDILNLQKRVQVLEKAVRSLAGQTSK